VTGRRVAAAAGSLRSSVLLVAGCGLAVASSELPAGTHPEVDFRGDEISAARAAAVSTLREDAGYPAVPVAPQPYYHVAWEWDGPASWCAGRGRS
jgi:hypothetical protein